MAANGQRRSDENFLRFEAWLANKTNEDFGRMVNRDGFLSRKQIVTECGFGGSALNQNPRIRATLLAKETELRERGILPTLGVEEAAVEFSSSVRMSTSTPTSFDTGRLGRTELENILLRAENEELKRQLKKFAVLREMLSTAGRLPR